ncbi:hypothetical protein MRX96_000868 [Rhipicephalus microplus]
MSFGKKNGTCLFLGPDSACDTSSDCAPVGAACVATPDGPPGVPLPRGLRGRRPTLPAAGRVLDGRPVRPERPVRLRRSALSLRLRARATEATAGLAGRPWTPGPTPGCDCGPYARCVYDPTTGTQRCVCEPGTDGVTVTCAAAESRGHVCQCQPGFTGDGRTCAPAPRATGEEYLLFGQGNVHSADAPGTEQEQPGTPSPHGTPSDGGRDRGRLRRAAHLLDGRGVREPCGAPSTTGRRPRCSGRTCGRPRALPSDWASRNLFWTDSVDDTVEVASLDGAYHHVIVNTGLVNPRGIAVHPALGRLYWSDWDRSSPRIESCHMDGSGRLVLVEGDGLQTPNMLALDLEAQRLVLDGRWTTHRRVYWTDWTIPFIHVVDRNGGTAEPLKLPLGGNGKLYGITAVSDKCPQLANACSPPERRLPPPVPAQRTVGGERATAEATARPATKVGLEERLARALESACSSSPTVLLASSELQSLRIQ